MGTVNYVNPDAGRDSHKDEVLNTGVKQGNILGVATCFARVITYCICLSLFEHPRANFLLQAPGGCIHLLWRSGKSIGKAILLDAFLRQSGLRNLQTQVVLVGKNRTSIHLPLW